MNKLYFSCILMFFCLNIFSQDTLKYSPFEVYEIGEKVIFEEDNYHYNIQRDFYITLYGCDIAYNVIMNLPELVGDLIFELMSKSDNIYKFQAVDGQVITNLPSGALSNTYSKYKTKTVKCEFIIIAEQNWCP